MATYKIFKLHFTSPLHIADRHADSSNSLKTIQSDTLYAALRACLAKTGATIPDDGDLGFTVSSMFPYYQRGKDGKSVYFLPMPMQARMTELTDVLLAKKVKKIGWVDAELYAKVLSGESFFDGTDKYYSCIQESYLSETVLPEDVEGSKEFVKSEVSQRVTLQSRTGEEDAKPYHVDKIIWMICSDYIIDSDKEKNKLKKEFL